MEKKYKSKSSRGSGNNSSDSVNYYYCIRRVIFVECKTVWVAIQNKKKKKVHKRTPFANENNVVSSLGENRVTPPNQHTRTISNIWMFVILYYTHAGNKYIYTINISIRPITRYASFYFVVIYFFCFFVVCAASRFIRAPAPIFIGKRQCG